MLKYTLESEILSTVEIFDCRSAHSKNRRSAANSTPKAVITILSARAPRAPCVSAYVCYAKFYFANFTPKSVITILSTIQYIQQLQYKLYVKIKFFNLIKKSSQCCSAAVPWRSKVLRLLTLEQHRVSTVQHRGCHEYSQEIAILWQFVYTSLWVARMEIRNLIKFPCTMPIYIQTPG